MPRVITLTTDFGTDDPYVGIMKGIILGINPRATIVDVSHAVAPQDIASGAFIALASFRYFPLDTIHVVVVDPGVGSDRAAVVLETDRGLFVGPDNGVLTWAARGTDDGVPGAARARRAIALTERRYWLPALSQTFHGRDVFAPVAAHLSLGVAASRLGKTVDEVVQLPWPQAKVRSDGSVRGQVIHVDRFGNLVTSIPNDLFGNRDADITVGVGGKSIKGLSRCYVGAGLIALKGSAGFLEISVVGGSAADYLRCGRGEEVVIRGRTERD